MLLLAAAVVLLLVLLNGLFAMSELAVVSSRKSRLQSRAQQGDGGARAALKLSEDPTRFLSAVQVGITLIGIFAGAFGQATIASELDLLLEGAPGLGPYSEEIATVVVVVLLTYLSLILGELVPKRLALIHPEAIASLVARPLSLLARLMGPFVTLLTISTAAVLTLLRVRDSDGTKVTQEEVEAVLAEGAGAGLIEPQEEAMMHEIMRLGDRAVRVAMTPRTEVYWVSLDHPEERWREEIRTCPYSRFILARGENLDGPLGVVHKRDIADALLCSRPLDLSGLARAPLYIPETASLLQALEQFRTSEVHLALVVDEFGVLQGVMSPTDLLEMIAGDLPEAHDGPAAMVRPHEDGSFLVDGRVDLVELGEALGVDDLKAGGFHTAAGLVLAAAGRIPEKGEVLHVGDFDVDAIDVDERRINKLLFRRRSRN
ncbi:hemolysin family protein [Phenylobacterium sp.]|uniref:hemolysin family protein n=1 Tax=Phenylobacterium sp. TaxID=1871053 RepID=UPI0035B0D3A9